LKDFVQAFVLQSCLGPPESMLISCTYRSIADRIRRYYIQSQISKISIKNTDITLQRDTYCFYSIPYP